MIQKKELSKRGLILAMSVLTAGIFGLNQRLDALETRVADDTIPQNVLNLDLCTLAYQLYHQSLCLPLDPWYDIMSRPGSDRRTNIRRFTHDYAKTLGMATATDKHSEQGFYSGPNAARGWANSNLNLDPVLTNYKQIDPKLPMFTRDGAIFLAALAPTYVTENLKAVEGIRRVAQVARNLGPERGMPVIVLCYANSIQVIGTPTLWRRRYQRAELQRQSSALATNPARTGLR